MQDKSMAELTNDDIIVITRKKTDRTDEPAMPDAVYAHAFRGYLLQKEAGVYDDAAGRVRLPENRLQDF